MTYVLDASAILRYLDGEAGAESIPEIVAGRGDGAHRILVSAVNWGEVAGVIHRMGGTQGVLGTLDFLRLIGMECVPATEQGAVRSALLKARTKMPYADAFGVQLASDSSNHILVTAHFDAKAAEGEVRIEFLPVKSRKL